MRGIKSLSLCFVSLLFIFITAQQTFGFETEEYATLNANDAGAGDQYGFCVDTDGKWLVIGAKYATVADSLTGNSYQTGAAYIYKKNEETGEWDFHTKLVPENEYGISPAEFGESVTVAHNKILIGARSMRNSSGHQSGTAYLYQYRGKKKGWVMEAEVEPYDGRDGDEFGRSVALGPDRLFVGARFASTNTVDSCGAVYVYKKRGHRWLPETKIIDPNGGTDDQFGRAISFDAKRHRYLAVGSRSAADGVGDQGKVIVFQVRGKIWSWLQEIEAYDGTDSDYFGQSLALSGDLLVVGSRDSLNDDGEAAGAAYIYRLSQDRKEWIVEQKLAPEKQDPADDHNKAQYGFAVDFDRQTETQLAVSARRMNSTAGKKTGQVFLYSYNTETLQWDLDVNVVPDESVKDDEFGQSLSMDPNGGRWLIVGADQTTVDTAVKAGTVYILKSTEIE